MTTELKENITPKRNFRVIVKGQGSHRNVYTMSRGLRRRNTNDTKIHIRSILIR
jgi:hypothetical protein